MATIEELEARVLELESDKQSLETQLQKVSKNKGELLNEKKKFQSLEKFLQDLGLATDDFDGIGEKLAGLIEPTADPSKTSKNFIDALKQQTEAQKLQMANLEATLKHERIERLALTELSRATDVVSPVQLRMLLQDKLMVDDTGKLIVSENGVEVEFGKHLDTLRKNPDWQNQFKAQTKSGMGSETNGGAVGNAGKKWAEMNTTERAIAANEHPESAKADLDAAGLGLFAP